MLDPLAAFRWDTLEEQYDARCVRFDGDSPHLALFGRNRPRSDRELYHKLLPYFTPAARLASEDLADAYEALLYWKYYSQGTADHNIDRFGATDTDLRRDSTKQLQRLILEMPGEFTRDADEVLRLVGRLKSYDVPCMRNCAIPTMTTLLHFSYPDTVPVFDKKVLEAVGEDGSGRSKLRVFRRYLCHAWELADRYVDRSVVGRSVTPLRAIDMALWAGFRAKARRTRRCT